MTARHHHSFRMYQIGDEGLISDGAKRLDKLEVLALDPASDVVDLSGPPFLQDQVNAAAVRPIVELSGSASRAAARMRLTALGAPEDPDGLQGVAPSRSAHAGPAEIVENVADLLARIGSWRQLLRRGPVPICKASCLP